MWLYLSMNSELAELLSLPPFRKAQARTSSNVQYEFNLKACLFREAIQINNIYNRLQEKKNDINGFHGGIFQNWKFTVFAFSMKFNVGNCIIMEEPRLNEHYKYL
ncbi:hypothetical protein CEXT_349881 [Caerostris extrusa]|uniref:Uncharacterized protein n=1 Tax=Caerostris extrusa TaxID=172846 RepID=A0AAV4N833_CAEEX|nr:hypothetical protein CEXT_349881 [Caerostris extrusa]